MLPCARAKDIALTLAGDEDPFCVVADPDRLRQVMWNLLANAVKLTPNGGAVELALQRAPAASGSASPSSATSSRPVDPNELVETISRSAEPA